MANEFLTDGVFVTNGLTLTARRFGLLPKVETHHGPADFWRAVSYYTGQGYSVEVKRSGRRS